MGRQRRSNSGDHKMARALDDLAEFESYQREILPVLQLAIKEGWTAEKILSHPKAQALLAARQLTIGIMDKDSGKALAAIKDAMDRTIGKPTEKQEISHKLQNLGDNELDALLETALRDSSTPDADTQSH